jgi:subtilase family serine protease
MFRKSNPSGHLAWLALVWLLSACPVFGAGLKPLPGHVPEISKKISALGRLPATNELHLAIGVPLRDPAGLDKFLADVYDPASSNYRHFLTPTEFAARFSATEADYAAVKNFALTNGFKITGEHGNRLLLDVTAKAAEVERAFHFNLKKFKHPKENREFFAPDAEPTVDLGLAVVDVQGLSDYSRPQPRSHQVDLKMSAPRNGSAPDGSSYFGNDFRNAYVPGTVLTGAGQQVGLLQFDGFYAADIAKYAQQTGSGRTNIPVQAVLLDGVSGTPGYSGISGANGEVSLDIEMAMAMAPGLAKIVVFEGNLQNSILNAMAASNTVKNLSSSWGWSGGPSTTTDNIFKTLAAQGQSFFNASGDSCAFTVGASSVNGVDNTSIPNAPSSSPYITQVGGTTLMTGGGATYSSETVWNWGGGSGSSGGVSSYYSIPSWQTNVSMTANLGSTTQRNIPDVALTADGCYVYSGNGSAGSYGGTSCAAPLWAGFMALVNQQAVANGNPTAGFINPAIYAIGKGQNPGYSYAACFHDTTVGNNYWSNSLAQYPAVAGYDLCTGWGTPNGINLINALAGPADSLLLFGAPGFSSVGAAGGPFYPTSQSVVFSNITGSSITWSLIQTSSWLSVSAAVGKVLANATDSFTVSVNANAQNLMPGIYSSTLLLSNQVSQNIHPLAFTLVVGQNAVANGGFETGDYSGWTLADGGGPDLVTGTTVSPHAGSYCFAFGQANSSATLTQSLQTVPGQPYLISFWLSNPKSGTIEQFQANWNGTLLYSVNNPAAFSWTNKKFTVTATNSSATLQFVVRNDPWYFGLDDVSVTPIPAPNVTAARVVANNNFVLTWNTLAGITNIVQYKTNLVQTNWINLFTNVATTNTFIYTNAVNGDPNRFYRIQRLP